MSIKTVVEIEKLIRKRLKKELGPAGEQYFAGYLVTRDKLTKNIYGEIKGAEPSLSDHSLAHIENVLNNAAYLLSDRLQDLSALELYCLAIFILFHDVGNLFGRLDHQQKISEVYDWARGKDASLQREKTLVLTAARAHTGLASDKTRDTLKELGETDHLAGVRIRLRELSAILRFADELAEGPQRSSDFMREHAMYDPSAMPFHEYAAVTHVFIDRGNSRICLTYEIDIGRHNGESESDRDARIERLLTFAYGRAVKLDQERRYTRFYSDALTAFKMTSIIINFRCEGKPLSFNLPPIQLDEKIIPGDPCRSLTDIDPGYRIPALLARVIAEASARTNDNTK